MEKNILQHSRQRLFAPSLLNKTSRFKSFFASSLMLLLALCSNNVNAAVVTIGSGAATAGGGTNGNPIYRSAAGSTFNFSQSIHLITEAELIAAGILPGSVINSLAWFKNDAFQMTAGRTANWTIHIKSTAATALTNSNLYSTWSSTATEVYSNPAVGNGFFPAAAGFVTLTFSTPYVYAGGSLEIGSNFAIATGTGNASTGAFSWTRDATPTVQAVGTSAGAAITSNLTTTNLFRYRIQFDFTPAAQCVGIPNTTTTSINNPIACVGQTRSLTATGATTGTGISYQWEITNDTINGPWTNATGTSNAFAYTSSSALSAGNYFFRFRTICDATPDTSYSNIVSLTVNVLPNVTAASTATASCAGIGTTLNASSTDLTAPTYAWAPASVSPTSGASVVATPATFASVTYTVTATNSFGCTSTATAGPVVGVAAPVLSSTSATPNSICIGNTSTLATSVAQAPSLITQYSFVPSIGATYSNLVGGTQIIGSSNDDTPSPTPNPAIGFPFTYNAVTYNNFAASPDGWIMLGTGAAVTSFSNSMTLTNNQPKIAAFWDDLATGTDGSVNYLLDGTAPNRILKIEWFVTVPRNTAGAANSRFQMWLYEGTNQIQLIYGPATNPAQAMTASIGLTAADGASVIMNAVTSTTTPANSSVNAAYQNLSPIPVNGVTYTFAPPAPPTYSYDWQPVADITGGINNAPTAEADLLSSLTSTIFTVTVTSNNGCSVTGTAALGFAGGGGTPSLSTPSITVPVGQVNGICDGFSATVQSNFINGGSPFDWTLTYPDATTYTVQTVGSAFSTTFTPTLAQSGTYILACSDACGNAVSENFILNVNPIPAVTITSALPGGVICGSGTNTLTAANADTYVWTPAAGLDASTGSTVVANIQYAQVYTVVGTDLNGCKSTVTQSVSFDATPTVVAAANPASVCANGSSTLSLAVTSPGGPQVLPTGYCASAATSTGEEEILNVTFGTLNNTTSCAAPLTGAAGGTANTYADFTNLTPPNAPPGGTMPFSINIGDCSGGSFGNNLAIYIDYNRDGDFADAGETTHTSNGSANRIVTGNITVPPSASLGLTRLRVVAMEGTAPACTAVGTTWGEVEDYAINIGFPTTPITSYSWTPATNLNDVTLAGPTASNIVANETYTVTVTQASGCTTTASVAITAGSPFSSNAITASLGTTMCGGLSNTLSITGTGGGQPYAYQWTNSANATVETTSSVIFNGNADATYTCVITDACGASSTETIFISVTAAPVPVISSSITPALLCGSGSVTLSVAGTDTYAWAPATGLDVTSGASVVSSATATTIYTVTATNGAGCTSTTQISVLFEPAPTWVTVNANPGNVCNNGISILTAQAQQLTTGPQTAPTGYCASAATSATEEEIFNVTFGSLNNTTTCATPLAGAAGGTASLYANFTNLPAPTVNGGTAVPFSVNINDCSGGSFGNTMSIYIDYNRDGDFADAGETVHTSTGTANRIVTGNITIPPTAALGATRMRVVAMEGAAPACTGVGTTWGEVEDYTINIQNLVPISGANTVWTNATNLAASTGTTVATNPLTVGEVYTVTATAPLGCTITSTLAVNVAIPFTNTNISSDAVGNIACQNQVVTLTANFNGGSPAFNYQWFDANNNIVGLASTLTFTASSSTTYSVSITDACGESASATIAITVNPAPTPAISSLPANGLICGGIGNVTLTGTGGDTYAWAPAATVVPATGASVVATPVVTTIYTLTATDAVGCTSTTTYQVGVEAIPSFIAVIPSPVSVCSNTPASMSATAQQLQSGPQTSPTGYCANAATSTGEEEILNVTFGSINNTTSCAAPLVGAAGGTANTYANFTNLPAPTITSGATTPFSIDINDCSGGSFGNTLSIYIDYNRDGDFLDAGENAHTSTGTANRIATGNITVPVTASLGVTRMRVVAMEGAAPACAGTGTTWGEVEDYNVNIIGIAPLASSQLSWQPAADFANNIGNNVTTNNLSANQVYTVTASGPLGCTFTSTVNVIVGAPLSAAPITSTSGLTFCSNNPTTLTAAGIGGGVPYSYQWSDANGIIPTATSATFTTNVSDTYTVTITDFCNVTASATISLTVLPLPIVAASATNTLICGSGSTSLSATGADTYVWTPGNLAGSSVTVSPVVTTNYTVIGTDAAGCSNSSNIPVIFSANPVIASVAANPATVCVGGTSTLSTALPAIVPSTYAFAASSSTYAPIAGTSVSFATGSADDGVSASLPIGFSFTYNGVAYTTFNMSTNGNLQLNTAQSNQWTNNMSAPPATNMICPFWDDNNIGTGSFNYITTGTAPNRKLIAQWTNVSIGGGGSASPSTANYQVVLNEDNSINFVYGAMSTSNTVSASIGLTGTSGNFLSATLGATPSVSNTTANDGNSSTATLTSGTMFTFTPPSPSTITWSNTAVGNTTTVITNSNSVYTVTATNGAGCSITSTVAVNVSIPTVTASAAPLFIPAGGTSALTASGAATYVWDAAAEISGANTGATVTALPTATAVGAITTYTVTGTSALGCTSTATASVTIADPLSITASGTNPLCSNGLGTITFATVGGSSPVTVTQNGNAATSPILNVSGGSYTLVATDAIGQTSSTIVVLTIPAAILPNATVLNVPCFGAASGSISLAPSNGTAPYTYAWNPGAATTSSITGLIADTYDVVITDANGCTATASYVISQPASFVSATINVTNAVSCFGGNNGAADVVVSGGTPSYTIAWENGATTAAVTNFAAGTYSVLVTDANGCTVTSIATIAGPASALSASVNTVNAITCNGAADGEISVIATGGTQSYTYAWSANASSAATANVTGLGAGTYSVIVTDANGCTTNVSYVLTQPALIAISTSSLTNSTCFGADNGTATLSITGGTVAGSYLILADNGNLTGLNLTDLPVGNTVVSVADDNFCQASYTITITEPTALTYSNSVTNLSCAGNNTGAIDVTVSGGTAPYAYAWTPGGASTEDLTGLAAGDYTLVVTDANNCSITLSANVSEPGVLGATISSTNVNCNGNATGSATVQATGGTGAYNYAWSNNVIGDVNTGLVAGVYTANVTDANGCSATATVTITEPAVLITSAVETTPIACVGGSAVVTVSATGGTTPYAAGTGTFSAAAGTYTYTVNDANGCSATATILVTEPTAVMASVVETTPVACVGGSAVVTVSATGGTTPYAAGTGTFSAAAGTYTYTVSDANGCSATATIMITEPTAVIASAVETTPIACVGGSAVVTVSATGGTTPYAAGTGTFSAAAGTYTYTVSDANGCSATATIMITEPTAVMASAVETTPIACVGGSAVVTVSATGGTTPYAAGTGTFSAAAGTYTYSVSDANGCSATATVTITEPSLLITSAVETTPVACVGGSAVVTVSATGGTTPYAAGTGTFSAAAGTYTYTVSDANGCSATATIMITEPTAVVASAVETTPVACNGGSAVVTVSATGGTTPYAAGTGTFSAVAGTYTYTVSDANGCSATATIMITEPTAVMASAVETTPIACNSGSAVVTVSATGGTTPYAAGTGTFSAAAGTYTYTVSDANGCSATATIMITEPTAVMASAVETTPVACNGGSAVVTVSATGGTTPYAAGTGTFSAAAGTYTYTVSDANGCSATATIMITEPTAVVASAVETTPIACVGGSAVVTVSATGGTTPYAAGTGTFSAAAGTYTYTVSDANGCSATATIMITEPTAVMASAVETTPIACVGGSAVVTVSATGGTTPYAAGTGTFSAAAGTYTYTISDANGCSATATIMITEPTAVMASAVETTPVACNGGSAVVTVSASGGTTPYAAGTGTFSAAAGTYTYTVSDANGCSATATIMITEPTAVIASAVETTLVACNGGSAVVTVSATGGTTPYASGTGTFSAAAGTYTYTVSDANGCSVTATIMITEPTAVMASAVETTPIACNGGSAVVTVSATGGTTPYAAGTGTFSAAAGTYTYTVSDANGCSATATIMITEPTAVVASAAVTTPVACNSGSAVVTVSATGGTTPYAAGTGTFSAAAGTYTYTVSDANGCSATATVMVTEPTVVMASAVETTPVACNGGSAVVTVSATGGTTPYAAGTGTFSAAAGTYTYTVSDANGCSATATIMITEPTAVMASAVETTPVACNGGSAVVTVSATGGTTPYAAGTGTFNAAAGTYTYTVSDANGCSATATIMITEPTAVVINAIPTNASCAGTFGSIALSATGGVAPITILVNGSAPTASYLAGSYTVDATDANGCSVSTIVTILNVPAVSIAGSGVTPLCAGSLGSITYTVLGGAAPVNVTLNGAPTTSPITGLTSGTYVITATDANNCTTDLSVTIAAAPAPVTAVNVLKSNVLCSGGTTGVMQITSTGGNAPYSYTLAPSGATSSTGLFNGLAAGIYTATISDVNACTGTTVVTILQPATLGFVLPVNTNPTACAPTSGATSVFANGGTGLKTYAINPTAVQSIPGTFIGLAAGSYTVTTTDVNACNATTVITLVQNAGVSVVAGTVTSPACNGANNGSATVTSTGGSGGYTYTINPNKTQTSVGTFTGLGAGSYTITSKDASNCTATTVITVSQPTPITYGPIVSTQPTCNGGANGGFTAMAIGGTSPYTYALTAPAGIQPIPGTFANLTSKIYVVIATDANGCKTSKAILLAQPAKVNFSNVGKTNVTCNGGSDGAITVVTGGGVGAKTLSSAPSGTVTGSAVSGLTANTYTLTATDANSCTATTTVVVSQAPALVWNPVVTANPTATATGSIVVSVVGGTGTKSYQIAPLAGTQAPSGTFGGLAAGTYTMTATDTKSCSISTTVTLAMTAIVVNEGNVTIAELQDGLAKQDIKIYPNPTPGPLTAIISAKSDANATIYVTDASGKRVKTIETILFAGENEIKLDVRELPNGIYMLQVNTTIGDTYNKVINKQ